MLMKTKPFNLSVLSAGVFAASLSLSGVALGQAETTEEEAEKVLETVIVTGTRLERSSFDTTQPSTSFDSEFILNNGFNNVGQTYANLYNLGSQRTLTLINGRRTVSGNAPTAFGATGGSQVDLNTIPTSLVERVEVVSIGGAPIYGSDAIAGVINVLMKRDFEGFEVDFGSGSAADGGDAWEHRMGVTAGFNFAGGRGNIAFGYEYNKTDAVLYNDRDYTRDYYYDFDNPDYDADDPSTGTRKYYAQGRSIPIVTKAGVPGSGPGPVLFAFGIGYLTNPATGKALTFDDNGRLTDFNLGKATGNAITFEGGEGLLLQDYGSIRAPIERHLANVFGRYDITDNVSAFWEANIFNGQSSDPNAQPFYQSALFGGTSTSLKIPLSNPYIDPADRALLVASGAGESIWLQKAMDDLAQSGATEGETDTVRLIGGFEGQFELMSRDFNWDISYNRGVSESESNSTQLVEDKYREALDVEVNDAGEIVCSSGNAACVPLNILGIVTDKAAIDYVTTQGYETGKITQNVFQANLSGDIISLPGGPMQVGVGYEQRKETGDYRPDYFLANGLGRTAALAPLSGGFDTKEWYVETIIPLVDPSWLPILTAVEIEGAYRDVDHSNSGRDDTWNIGARIVLDIPVVGEVTLRGNVTEAVRAPSIVELFLPQSETFSFANDPCDPRYLDSGPSPDTRRATCLAEAQASGASYDPLTFESVIVNASQQGFTGGNPNLENEGSEASSLGVVYRPAFTDDLVVSLDYLDIELTNAIEALGLGTLMASCYDSGNLGSAPCRSFSRDENFQVNNFLTGQTNAGFSNLKAYQLNFSYSFDLSFIPGVFSLNGGAFHIKEDEFSVTGIESDVNDVRGLIGNSDTRVNLGLSYLMQNWRFNWQTAYMSDAVKAKDIPDRFYDVPSVDDYWLHTVTVGHTFGAADNIDVRLAVRNVFDEEPPYGINSLGVNGIYDLVGRYATGSITVRF
jgi:iron complex outermembrane recepter protein